MILEELNKELESIMEEHNNAPKPDFEGYSPLEMNYVLRAPLSENCVIQMRTLTSVEYELIPIFQLVKFLLSEVAIAGELKLTKTGALPVKIVKELYQKGYYKEMFIEKGVVKLYKESDSLSITLTRIISELSGILKKRNGKLSLTKKGEKIKDDNVQLFSAIFDTYTQKFNWGYFDSYETPNTGRLGFAFTLILLLKFGNERRSEAFYAEKYVRAFPLLLDEVVERYRTAEDMIRHCYTYRVFGQFIPLFGFALVEDNGKIIDRTSFITKTPLIDKLFYLK